MFGFLNIYKPRGMTSHDVVSRLRKITKVKQIGHTGTLDPFAEGVLPICIGKATRLIEYLDDDKAYEATIQLGAATTTYDLEGEITFSSSKKVTVSQVEQSLNSFRGEIEQKPPIFSAIKLQGKKLYEYARKGEAVEIPVRRVTVYKLELLDFNEELQQARVLIECSKGTYIRSIANDLGEVLGVGGHLIKLVRVKAGMFAVSSSVTLEGLELEQVKLKLCNPMEVMNYKKYEISEADFQLVKNGMQLDSSQYAEQEIILLTFRKELISVAEYSGGKLSPKKVFIN